MANIVSVEESIRFNAGCGPTAHPPSTCADVIHALSMYTESGSAVRVAKKRCFRHCLQCLATAADRVGHRGSHEGLSKPFQGRALSSSVRAKAYADTPWPRQKIRHLHVGVPPQLEGGQRRTANRLEPLFETMQCDATFDLSVRSSLIDPSGADGIGRTLDPRQKRDHCPVSAKSILRK